jgi:lipoprotein-releasing system permease protein
MIFLAFRYLLERRKQSLFTLLGVFLGTMSYVGVSGFFKGFQGYMVQQLIDNTAQIHIQARQDILTDHELDRAFYDRSIGHVFWSSPPSGLLGYFGVQNPQGWYARLAADKRVEAFSPLISAPVLFTLAKNSVSSTLIGCDPLQQSKVTSIAKYMVEGKFTDIAGGGNRVIMGDELMRRIGAAKDQIVLVSVGTRSAVPMKVVGRYMSGNRGSDLQAYASLNDVQRLNGTPNRVNEIAVRLKDYNLAASIAQSWTLISPEKIESWDQQNINILSVIRMQTTLRFTMIFAILLVAGFGIYNVLNMTVTQKRQDIAILRSMGYDTFDIVALFFSQGIMVGITGAAFGLLSGYLLCRYLQTISFFPPGSSHAGETMHIAFDVGIYIQATLLALIAAAIASILPARAAGKLTPIEIIRTRG